MKTMLLKTLIAITLIPLGQSSFPSDLPYRVVGGAVAIEANVGGHKRLLVLDAGASASKLRDASDKGRRLAVGVAGAALGEANFVALKSKTEAEDGTAVEGTLGLDVLRNAAVGVDLDAARAALWSKGVLDPTIAEAWVRGPDGPPDAPVVRLPLVTLPDGQFGLPLEIGGKRTVAALGLRAWGGYLLPSVRTPVHPFGFATLVPDVKIAGEPIPWLLYPRPSPDLDEQFTELARPSGSGALLALDAFASPRTLVDFAAKVVYVRRSTADERLTRLMRQTTDASVTIRGDRIVVAPSGSTSQSYPPEFASIVGQEVLRIAGKPASEWLAALRDPTEAGATRLARLLSATVKNYSFFARDADGDEQEIKVVREE